MCGLSKDTAGLFSAILGGLVPILTSSLLVLLVNRPLLRLACFLLSSANQSGFLAGCSVAVPSGSLRSVDVLETVVVFEAAATGGAGVLGLASTSSLDFLELEDLSPLLAEGAKLPRASCIDKPNI